MIEIKQIGEQNASDINLKNEPFKLHGRMKVKFDGKWSHTFEESDKSSYQTFPDESYDFAKMRDEYLFTGAYENGKCVALAIWQKPFNKYLYLYDLKVSAKMRGKGIGRKLIETGASLAKELGAIGIYTVAQDNNVDACKFYIACGFEVGGLDTRAYDGTSQAGKSDIYFYKDN